MSFFEALLVCIATCAYLDVLHDMLGFQLLNPIMSIFAQICNQRLAKPTFAWAVSCFSTEVLRSITFDLHGNLIVAMIYTHLIFFSTINFTNLQSTNWCCWYVGLWLHFPFLSSDEPYSFIPAVTGALAFFPRSSSLHFRLSLFLLIHFIYLVDIFIFVCSP